MTEAAALAAAAGEGEGGSSGDEEEGEQQYSQYAAAAAAAAGGAKPAGAGSDGAGEGPGADDCGGGAAGAADRRPLVSAVDATAWKLEAERAAPRLAFAPPPGARDWRQHLDAAGARAAALAEGWPGARAALGRLAASVGSELERVALREAALGAAAAPRLGALAAARAALAVARDEAAAAADAAGARDAELHRLGAALEAAKIALEERSSSLSDASPLVRAKAAAAALRAELGAMEVCIGVVGHALAHLSMDDRQAMLRDAAARVIKAAAGSGGGRGTSARWRA
jgi:hypothetical protein